MPLAKSSIAVLGVTLIARMAFAQATPFIFTMTPTASNAKATGYGYYELGYGERTFEPVAGDRLEQAVGCARRSGHR